MSSRVKRVTVDPITRLEGHGKIEIFLDEAGDVANAYIVIPELRGFEQFCVGRPAEEMPRITNRICGVCPEAHHMAATKALDDMFHVEPTSVARKLRELPGKNEVLAQLLGAIQGPASELVRTLEAPASELYRTLQAPMRELALTIPRASALFRKYDMDYCCGGKQTLERAASRKELRIVIQGDICPSTCSTAAAFCTVRPPMRAGTGVPMAQRPSTAAA